MGLPAGPSLPPQDPRCPCTSGAAGAEMEAGSVPGCSAQDPAAHSEVLGAQPPSLSVHPSQSALLSPVLRPPFHSHSLSWDLRKVPLLPPHVPEMAPGSRGWPGPVRRLPGHVPADAGTVRRVLPPAAEGARSPHRAFGSLSLSYHPCMGSGRHPGGLRAGGHVQVCGTGCSQDLRPGSRCSRGRPWVSACSSLLRGSLAMWSGPHGLLLP